MINEIVKAPKSRARIWSKRGFPSDAACAAHGDSGWWLGQEPDGTLHIGRAHDEYGDGTFWMFWEGGALGEKGDYKWRWWPVDKNGQRVPWPTDSEGKPL